MSAEATVIARAAGKTSLLSIIVIWQGSGVVVVEIEVLVDGILVAFVKSDGG